MSDTAALNAAALNAAAKASRPSYTPARILALDVPGALSRALPAILAAADGGNISGRHLHMTPAAYAAAVGRMSADSVAGALCYAVVHYFNGSRTLQDLADAPDAKGKATLPAWLGAGIRETFTGIKPRNACDPETLREWTALLWGKVAAAVKPAAALAAESGRAPGPVSVMVPAPAPKLASAYRGPAAPEWALIAGGMTREVEAGAMRADYARAYHAPAVPGILADLAPVLAPAPVVVPTLGNDYPADAAAFIAQVGEDRARKFLEALAATLAPAIVEAMPDKPRRVRTKKAA